MGGFRATPAAHLRTLHVAFSAAFPIAMIPLVYFRLPIALWMRVGREATLSRYDASPAFAWFSCFDALPAETAVVWLTWLAQFFSDRSKRHSRSRASGDLSGSRGTSRISKHARWCAVARSEDVRCRAHGRGVGVLLCSPLGRSLSSDRRLSKHHRHSIMPSRSMLHRCSRITLGQSMRFTVFASGLGLRCCESRCDSSPAPSEF
jgi:hypothetical protein